MTSNPQHLSFDEAAPTYDAVAESALGRELRSRVHDVMRPLVSPGCRLLDVGAGTGLDAATYVDWGAEVVAVEQSTIMAQHAFERLGDRVSIVVGDAMEVSLGPSGDPTFDVVVSNFGALNCMGPIDVVAPRLAAWVRPGGHLAVVVMGRCVPWEIAGGIRHLDRKRVTGRWRGRVDDVRYWSPRAFGQAMSSDSRRTHLEALGSWLPTYQQRSTVEQRPTLLRRLAGFDRSSGRLAGRLGVGDHWLGVWRGP